MQNNYENLKTFIKSKTEIKKNSYTMAAWQFPCVRSFVRVCVCVFAKGWLHKKKIKLKPKKKKFYWFITTTNCTTTIAKTTQNLLIFPGKKTTKVNFSAKKELNKVNKICELPHLLSVEKWKKRQIFACRYVHVTLVMWT